MKHYIPILSIAGSDCSGGAGIQADLKTISALGSYAATAITAITVQNTCGVSDIFPVPAETVKAQIAAVMEDIHPEAIKIGMVNDPSVIRVIAESIRTYHPRYVVLDPVMVSTSGHKLIKDEAIQLITAELMPLADLITPNLKEAEVLCGFSVHTVEDMKQAAIRLLHLGSQAVLLKGGHLEGDQMIDILMTADNPEHLSAPKWKAKTLTAPDAQCHQPSRPCWHKVTPCRKLSARLKNTYTKASFTGKMWK